MNKSQIQTKLDVHHERMVSILSTTYNIGMAEEAETSQQKPSTIKILSWIKKTTKRHQGESSISCSSCSPRNTPGSCRGNNDGYLCSGVKERKWWHKHISFQFVEHVPLHVIEKAPLDTALVQNFEKWSCLDSFVMTIVSWISNSAELYEPVAVLVSQRSMIAAENKLTSETHRR